MKSTGAKLAEQAKKDKRQKRKSKGKGKRK
jgi:hypothetical protein